MLIIFKEFLELTSWKNAVKLHREELPSFIGETYFLDALFKILKCNIKNMLLRSSEGGHVQFPVCVVSSVCLWDKWNAQISVF